MLERVPAAIVLAVCLVLLLRLVIGERRRYRFDAFFRRIGSRLRRAGLSIWHWRDARREAQNARKVADEVIKRARDRGEWDGNVYTPKSFRKPPRDKMH
ncbi:MAG: hypothetical protein ABI781_03025 [Burkholderiales bacterium]